MNPRPAAALALVSWYFIMPPKKAGVGFTMRGTKKREETM